MTGGLYAGLATHFQLLKIFFKYFNGPPWSKKNSGTTEHIFNKFSDLVEPCKSFINPALFVDR